MFTRLLIALPLATLPAVSIAQDLSFGTSTPNAIFTLRGGVATSPDYFGSSSYTVGPDLGFSLQYLRLPGGLSFGSTDLLNPRYGFGVRGSFRYIAERDDDEHDELAGLDDIDATYEVGLGLGYTSYSLDAFADLRYGVGGSEAVVGELGVDYKLHPSDRLVVTVGPRVLIGSDDYASTYFGVSPSEASRSAFPAYEADAGVVSTGLELGMRYELGGPWGVEGAITYDRFVGDAADSPIVEQGDRDQYGVRLGVTRQITLDF